MMWLAIQGLVNDDVGKHYILLLSLILVYTYGWDGEKDILELLSLEKESTDIQVILDVSTMKIKRYINDNEIKENQRKLFISIQQITQL